MAGLPDLFPLVTPPHITTPHGASQSCSPSKPFSHHGTSMGCKGNQSGLPSRVWAVTASFFYNVISISLSLSFFHGGWVDLGDDLDGFISCWWVGLIWVFRCGLFGFCCCGVSGFFVMIWMDFVVIDISVMVVVAGIWFWVGGLICLALCLVAMKMEENLGCVWRRSQSQCKLVVVVWAKPWSTDGVVADTVLEMVAEVLVVVGVALRLLKVGLTEK